MTTQTVAYTVAGNRRSLAAYQNTVKAAWKSACDHDKVDPDSPFIVFSDDNPFAPFYDKALADFQDAIRQYRAGGYLPVPA